MFTSFILIVICLWYSIAGSITLLFSVGTMDQSFPPTNPLLLLRIIVLLVLQDFQGIILYGLRFFDGYINSDVLKDYIENYPEYFMANLEEKQYLIQRYTPQIIQEIVLLPTSISRIHRLLHHPYVESAYLLILSLLVIILCYNRTQVCPEILLAHSWPKSIDEDVINPSVPKKEKDSSFLRAQSVLNMKSFPTSTKSSEAPIPTGRIGPTVINKQYMPQRTAVQPKAEFADNASASNTAINSSSRTEITEENILQLEQSNREAAKNARLNQFPPSQNPLAQKQPSRMRTLLKAATVSMGLKRTNSMSSVTSENSIASSASSSSKLPSSTIIGSEVTKVVNIGDKIPQRAVEVANTSTISDSPSAKFGGSTIAIPSSTLSDVPSKLTSDNDLATAALQEPPVSLKLSNNKPKLLLRFDSQDPSTLRVVEEEADEEEKEPPPSPLVKENSNRMAPRSNSYLTPPRPTVTRAATSATTPAVQTPYSTVSTLTPDSQFLSMVQRHRTADDSNPSNLSRLGAQDNSDDEDDDNASMFSEGTGYAASENGGTIVSSQASGYIDDANAPPEVILERSSSRPEVLIGWRVMVPGYGTGLILSIKKKRFSTTKFVIQLENGQIVALKLQRAKDKGNVPFHLLRKIR